MIQRRKRTIILLVAIILVIFIILGILALLYLKTDMLKSNETLFAKYLMQNFDAIEILKNDDVLEIENALNTNKYKSEIEGKIQYTENIGTSNENIKSGINDVGIKINSNIDKKNSYDYKNISIGTENEDLIKLEYLNQEQTYGIRLNGIKQFVSIENNEEEILQEIGIKNIEGLLQDIDINSVFDFSKEEKQSLINTYVNIIQENVPKNKYYKQSNSLITINNKDVKTNAYYIKLTIEEYNNLYIKILEQIARDEILLSRLDLIENEIKQKYSNYAQDKSLRETFINTINKKIEEIQSTNIGSQEVKIIVYENNMKTVRTSIEKPLNKTIIDLYNNSSIKIENTELGEEENEQSIKIEKNNSDTQANILMEFEKIQNNEIVNTTQLNYQQIFENNQITREMKLEILNEEYRSIIDIKDNIEFVQEFENQITLDTDNVKLNDLQKEQIEEIVSILNKNIQDQLDNLFSVVNLEEYIKMLQNLGVIAKKSVQIPDKGEVTDIERKRFNSQFEFFVSEDLTTDNIKDLMQIVEKNFGDMRVLLKDGSIEEVDIEKFSSNNQDYTDYKKNISEILILIKQNSKNEEKQDKTLKVIEGVNSKYAVSLEYDDNGLVGMIRIKVQDN